MARLYHSGDCHDDLCADLPESESADRNKHCRKHDRDDDRHFRKKRIPIGCVEVDCTPVIFETPGQARNIVSCPVSQPISVPVTRTVNVQVPVGLGCVVNIPVTETVQVPCTASFNLPPTLSPAPSLQCPTLAAAICPLCNRC